MPTRLSINERGELVKRDGTVVGRITAISVEMDEEAWGLKGVTTSGDSAVDKSSKPQPPTPDDSKLFEAPDAVALLWEHYQATIDGANRRKLDSTRLGCIRRALKVRSLDECKAAITGLAMSDWHNGRSPENRTKYLDIQYALGQKSESPDARIDKMAGKATTSNGAMTVEERLRTVPSDWRAIIDSKMRFARQARERNEVDEDAELQLREKVGIELHSTDGGRLAWRAIA